MPYLASAFGTSSPGHTSDVWFQVCQKATQLGCSPFTNFWLSKAAVTLRITSDKSNFLCISSYYLNPCNKKELAGYLGVPGNCVSEISLGKHPTPTWLFFWNIWTARSLIESIWQKSGRLIDDQVVRISRHDLRMNKTGRVSFKACD